MDIREELANNCIKEMLAEIDADTIRRYKLGQRLLPVQGGGHEWFYIVNSDGKVVDENGKILDLET